MRIPRLPVIEYFPPGDFRLAPEVEEKAAGSPEQVAELRPKYR